ncbi:MAG: serine hydrolase domain-containing protein [Pseudomonadota bacterium]
MEKHKARTLGIGIIRDGELVLTRYYGEQAPGIPASSDTMFNTASVSKAITSEVAIRLIDRGVINLDEAISGYYVHPDIKDDPRHTQLTPRILLTHKTGFLNWPHSYEDGKLAFIRDPGEAYGYSGVGFDIFAYFLEQKLGKPFPQIVKDELYTPLNMTKASQHQEEWMHPFMVRPLDETGQFRDDIGLDLGYWNPADDLFVTVEDYARFLIAVMNNEGLSEDAIQLRQTVQSDLTNDPVWECDDGGIDPCPSPYGHSVGWFVYGYGDRLNIQHGGNDMSEAATAYFKTDTRDGMIVFINAPNPEGIQMYVSVVDLLDEDQYYTKIFHYLFEKFFSSESRRTRP